MPQLIVQTVNPYICKDNENGMKMKISNEDEENLELRSRDELKELKITVQEVSNANGISDENLSRPKEKTSDSISAFDTFCNYQEQTIMEVETKVEEIFPSSSRLDVTEIDGVDDTGKEDILLQKSHPSPERACIGHCKKKLLVLDVNGLLADIISFPKPGYNPHRIISKKAVFKRPYCDDFLQFCFERFNIGVWSSRIRRNVDEVVKFLMGNLRSNLLFMWDASHCTRTGLNTIENKNKPLVLKELKKLWNKLEPNLPWEKGEYNETNTLLLDDSPYKALCNPAHTAIFPYSYEYTDANDSSLGPGGDLRVYLEGLAAAENVQEYIKQNPFGQEAITESNLFWGFYSKIIDANLSQPHDTSSKNQYSEVQPISNNSDIYEETKNNLQSASDMPGNVPEDSAPEVKLTATASLASATTDDDVDYKNLASISHATSEAVQKKEASRGACFESSLNGKFVKENEEKSVKSASDSLKVDKFGRLVREAASDSDSDDPHYNGRLSKQGRSRSRSPLDKLRRRSPWKRREKRSRSRSWSPRKRRSRSRSPRTRRSRSRSPRSRRSRSRSPRKRRSRSRSRAYRHVGEFSGENIRGFRGQVPHCFDFRRGRCYRGASCRYLHHEADKSDVSRRDGSKNWYSEVQPISNTSDIHEETKNNLHSASDMPGSSSGAKENGNIYQKREVSVSKASQCSSLNQDSQLVDCHKISSESSREVTARVLEAQVHQEEIKEPTILTTKNCQETMECHHPKLVDGVTTYPVPDADALKLHGHQDTLSQNNSVFKPSQSNVSNAVLQNADCPTQLTDNPSISDCFPERTSRTSVTKLSVTEALLTTKEIKHHSLQLPPPRPTLTQSVAAQHMMQPSGNYGLIPQSASLPIHSASGERFPSYMLPNQHSHLSVSSVPSWTSLPPPPPGVSSQLQQSPMPTGNDFGSQKISRPQIAELQTHSQVSTLQQQVYRIMLGEDLRFRPPSSYNSPSQQFGGVSRLREDHLAQCSMLGLNASSSFAQGDNQPLPIPFSQELPANNMQQFPGDSLPPGELLKSSSQIQSYPQPQVPPGLHHSAAISSSSRYPPDLRETNQSSHLPDFGGSGNLTHYNNPYASTSEQPLGSKFRSDDVRQEKDTTPFSNYAAPFNLRDTQVDGQDIGSAGSRQATSSPNSARAVRQNFSMSGGDQYDPLLDSIEPSSKLSKNLKNFQKWETSSYSDIMLRHNGSNKLLDVEETNEKKEVGGAALETSVANEECGETADAEVGAVVNESPSNPINDTANVPFDEIEIDQMKSPGKSKKSTESRSMKLFKVALAEFVKEVLKPSWQQGNMSKEAFKTIVKKTVDKVSGAMKSHQIPKSQAKIDLYIDSSQQKLTKLVTGYVDKYVKM